jgi:hypothetical protein
MKVVTVLCSVVLVCSIHATILNVPGDYPTIQQALYNAADGDTVLVAPGTYTECIVWPNTQSIVLMSEYGPDSTIIDGSGSWIVLTIETQVDKTTIVDGFTIRNGMTSRGAGIYCIDASPTICNNIICDNSASVWGGGIYCDNSYAFIKNNVFVGNTAGRGGGMCLFCSTPGIVDNYFTGNSAGSGGAIYTMGIAADNDTIEILNNTISNNTATYSGGGTNFYKSFINFHYNTVCSNTAPNVADGVLFHESSGEAHYNNIYENGIGMYADFSVGPTNAEYNWWGDSTGPYHATNPGGLGDTVSGYINFIPWLWVPYGVEERENHSLSVHSPMLRIYPNPVKQWCTCEYTIAHASMVRLALYDAAGRCIRNLADGQRDPGLYNQVLNLAYQTQGVYFVKLSTTDYVETKKLILLK